jgi:transcriptional regulator with XRE-family HTH domain
MLGERIAKLRKQKKLSQYDLADRLGFSRGKLANYEQGSRQPDFGTLELIADFFEVSIDYLLGRSDDSTPVKKENINIAFLDGDNLTEDEKKHLEIALEIYRAHNKKKKDNEEI